MSDEHGADNVVSISNPQNWRKACHVGAKGKGLLCNLHNALIALRNDVAVRLCFGFDEMARHACMIREIGKLEDCHRFLADADVMKVQNWLQQNGFPNIGRDTVRDAINLVARDNAFHPVREYLLHQTWDEVPRIGVWLPRYMGTEFNPYTQHIGRMFFVQMIARVAQPGCQADHMLVLEGPQGILKSSACRVLGGEWFSDHLPDITIGRDASMHLRNHWLIEVAEMHAMGKAEATQLKSFITRTTERYRPVYGHNEVIEPRQCVFVGTTNMDAYLKDPSGGRRFWPVRTAVRAPIDLEGLERDRDQLFAEAMYCYQHGDPWWPDQQFEREFIKDQQSERFAGDIWDDKIRQYVSGRMRVSVSEIAKDCLMIPDHQMNPSHGMRISGILRELGWTSRRDMKSRYWVLNGSR